MELRQLRYLDAVLETGTFGAAAEREHVSQPALWQQVRSLERQWGVSLLVRTGRRVRPTRTAEEVAPRVRAVLQATGQLAATVASISAGSAVAARYAEPRYARSAAYMFEIVRRYLARHPGAALPEPVSLGTSGLAEAVEGGLVDIAVAVPASGWRFASQPIYDVSLVAIGTDLPASRIEVADLAARPLAVLTRRYQSRVTLEEAWRRKGIEPKIVVEHDNPEILVAAARAGIATAAMVSDAFAADLDLPRAEVVEDGRPFSGTLCLIWRDDTSLPESARQLLNVAREYAVEVRKGIGSARAGTERERQAAQKRRRSAARGR
jgi:DNA-binding transcriptional LysR family regulator